MKVWVKHYTEIPEQIRELVLESLQTSTFVACIANTSVFVIGRNRTKRPPTILYTNAIQTTPNHVAVFNKRYAIVAEQQSTIFTPSLYVASTETLMQDACLYTRHENVQSLLEFLLRNAYITINNFQEANNLLTSIFT